MPDQRPCTRGTMAPTIITTHEGSQQFSVQVRCVTDEVKERTCLK